MTENYEEDRDKRHAQMLAEWEAAIAKLFPGGAPETAQWNDITDIVRVLKVVGETDHSNHMFYPNGGGNDLADASVSHEPGCIELRCGTTVIVKPQGLTFNSFGKHPEWSYFRLETGGLAPSGVYETAHEYEEVTELRPGQYVDRGAWDEGYYGHDEEGRELKLPKGARCLTRLYDGAFVIFSKASIYNQISDTYDGRHAKMSAADFREYIRRAVDGGATYEKRARYR
jgi:serine/threonine-protein kinase